MSHSSSEQVVRTIFSVLRLIFHSIHITLLSVFLQQDQSSQDPSLKFGLIITCNMAIIIPYAV